MSNLRDSTTESTNGMQARCCTIKPRLAGIDEGGLSIPFIGGANNAKRQRRATPRGGARPKKEREKERAKDKRARTAGDRRAVLNNRRKGGLGPREKQGSATPKRGALPQEDKDRETPPGDHALNTESADQRLGGKGAAGATQQLRCTCTYTCNLHPKGALLATIGHHGRLASGTTGLSLKRLDNIVVVQLESRFSS